MKRTSLAIPTTPAYSQKKTHVGAEGPSRLPAKSTGKGRTRSHRQKRGHKERSLFSLIRSEEEEGKIEVEELFLITRCRCFINQFKEVPSITDVVESSPMGSPVRGAGFVEPKLFSIPATSLGSCAIGESRNLTHSPLSPRILLH